MGHHSSQGDAEMNEAARKSFLDSIPKRTLEDATKELLSRIESEARLGPTGKFPMGKLTAQDEGEIRCAILMKDGKVVIDFGATVTWVGFSPEQARDIARALHEHAVRAALQTAGAPVGTSAAPGGTDEK